MTPTNAQREARRITPGRWQRLGLGPCDGSAAIEFALIMPIVVALLVFMFDLGTGGYVKARVESAAQAGTSYVEVHGWNEQAVVHAVRHATDLPALAVDATASCGCINGIDIAAIPCGNPCPDGSAAGVYVNVTASSQYIPAFPYPGIDRAMTLSASSIVRIN